MSGIPKILFIQTGGTIDKDYPRFVVGYGFEIGEPAAKRIMDRVNPAFDYQIQRLMTKDSQDLTAADRLAIQQACRQSNCDLIIITHGTDTMLQTARELDTLQGKTIILTGAFRPERFLDSDASFNLGVAVGAISQLSRGVYVAMCGLVIPWADAHRVGPTGKFVGGGVPRRHVRIHVHSEHSFVRRVVEGAERRGALEQLIGFAVSGVRRMCSLRFWVRGH
jgi:L-asparaginase